jgi:hypothetical protein
MKVFFKQNTNWCKKLVVKDSYFKVMVLNNVQFVGVASKHLAAPAPSTRKSILLLLPLEMRAIFSKLQDCVNII